MKYQVGSLEHFRDDDDVFDTQEEAEQDALVECLDESPYGVWEVDEETGHTTLICIAHESTLFYP